MSYGAGTILNIIWYMYSRDVGAAMPHKPSVKFSILSSAAGSAQIAVSSQSGDCSVTDEFQSTHLRLTRLVNSELTAACMHAAVTAGCDDLQNGRGSQYWWR